MRNPTMRESESPPTIQIGVEGRRIVYNTGFSVRARRGDIITWTCPFPFAIHFGDRTPFDLYSSSRAEGETVELRTRPNAGSGAYKYSVTVFTGSGAPLIDDPEVYIDNC
jgi:hypothetical protein